MKTIKIEIENGEVKVETRGFRGKGCVEAVKRLLEGLGRTGAEGHTQEYYLSEDVSVRQQQGGGR